MVTPATQVADSPDLSDLSEALYSGKSRSNVNTTYL
jgi:hypothetical protein